ncbi:hypothetical protein [Herbaspirillum sp. YR522]|uniref:hypothetical protein n=1 Tax=Herbaspirillum sp. YR522 TaxID=1144342 RepID=UPI00026FCCC3|nr:hypothetical protein [Herbaspirillum sp. YR522]EJN10476.1 hypothetical protein PMI40_00004 [Herbaspirillum sp. YR522]
MDLHHYIGDDLALDSTGDLLLAEDTIEGQQRVLRRLLTATKGYLWHQAYGAGVPGIVGQNYDEAAIRGVIRAQIFNEAVVSRSPDPVITVTQITNGASVRIQYQDAITRKPVSLNFNVTQ